MIARFRNGGHDQRAAMRSGLLPWQLVLSDVPLFPFLKRAGDLSALAIVAAVTGGQGLFFRAACAACVVHTAAQPLRLLAVQAPLLGQPITLPPSPTRMGHGAGG